MDSAQETLKPPSALQASELSFASSTIAADVPPEFVRQVAAGLKALAKVTPYDEYVAIVYRLARLKWRCATDDCAQSASARNGHGDPDDVVAHDTCVRLQRAALAYLTTYADLLMTRRSLMERIRLARSDASQSRSLSATQRVRLADAREARTKLRDAVRDYVGQLKARGTSLDAVLHETGRVVRQLHASGAIGDDQGALEAAMMRLAAEECCAAA
jgi:hypothetical protein